MKRILFLALLLGGISVSSVYSMSNAGVISKEDACKSSLPDWLYSRMLAISSYPGYSTNIWSFYKDNKKLYYVVDAENISNLQREAFLWSWDCVRKAPRKLSKYNFAIAPTYEKNQNSWIASFNYRTIQVIYGDKDHIFIRQPRTYKWETPPDKFLIFYRGNSRIKENFSLEDVGGFSTFEENIQNKDAIQVSCDALIIKECYGEFSKLYTIHLPKDRTWFRFYLESIKKDSNGIVYLEVDYKNSSISCPLWAWETSDQCAKHRFNIPIDLSQWTVNSAAAKTFSSYYLKIY